MEGIITEKLMELDELLLPKAEKEAELIEKNMQELKNTCASNKTIMFFMKELGMKRFDSLLKLEIYFLY